MDAEEIKSDLEFVEKLKKSKKGYKVFSWIVLVCGIIYIGLICWILRTLTIIAKDTSFQKYGNIGFILGIILGIIAGFAIYHWWDAFKLIFFHKRINRTNEMLIKYFELYNNKVGKV